MELRWCEGGVTVVSCGRGFSDLESAPGRKENSMEYLKYILNKTKIAWNSKKPFEKCKTERRQ